MYQYDPAADPEQEKQATKPASTAPAEPEATAPETTLAAAPTASPAADPATPAEGSAKKPTQNVINVVNNWVGAAAKELKIRLSNVNIKAEKTANKAAMDVSGGGTTKVELDGQNVLDSHEVPYQAGLRKQGEGTLIITDETNDEGKKITTPKSNDSGSLIAKGAAETERQASGEALPKAQKTSPSRAMQRFTQQAAGVAQASAAAASMEIHNLEMQKTSSSRAMQLLTQKAAGVPQALAAAAMEEMQKTSSSGGIPR